MYTKLFIATGLFMSYAASYTVPMGQVTPKAHFARILSKIGLAFDEDPHLPLHASQEILHIEEQKLICMQEQLQTVEPNSYIHTYVETLMAGQRGLITHIKQMLQEQLDADAVE